MPKDEKSAEKPLSPELEQLKGLYDLMLEKGLDVIEIKDVESRVRLTRRFATSTTSPAFIHHASPVRNSIAPAPVEPSASVSTDQIIAAPLAGVFYRASSPTSSAFTKEGDVVDLGQTLCIVEAMKVMNEIKAESRCRIVKIVAENGRPVSAGQTLFQTEPA